MGAVWSCIVELTTDPTHSVLSTPSGKPLAPVSLGCLGLYNPVRQAALHIIYMPSTRHSLAADGSQAAA